MTKEEQRERVIQGLTDLLKTKAFTVEYKVKKKPEGIKIVIEITQEELNEMLRMCKKSWNVGNE